MRTHLLLLVLVAVGCGKQRPGSDDDADDSADVVDGDDHDGDGSPEGEDCDDNDAGVFPGNAESCDGEDEDCDGLVDEGASDALPYYTDSDSDTWGDPATAEFLCEDPNDGRTIYGGDCDDADPDISPGETERCDGVDNNCDGEVDEDSSIDALAWFEDADGDGWGDSDGDTFRACEAPEGYGTQVGDCDDDNPDAYPGAPEYCDGFDNDCDATTDEPNAVDAVDWFGDGDGDGYGDPESVTHACDAPADHVDNQDDCDDTDASTYLGAAESCDDEDQDCDGLVDEGATNAPTWFIDSDRDGAGDASATIQSCDRPAGYAVSDDDCDDADPSSYPGAAETCGDGVINDCDGDAASALAQCSLLSDLTTADADASLLGPASGAYAGAAVAGVGDINSDGYDDVLVGAYRVSTANGAQSGAAYLVHGGVTGSVSLSSADAIFEGSAGSDNAGAALAAIGDVSGDGVPDLLIGAPGNDDGGRTSGAAYIMLGPITGTYDLADATAIITGAANYDGAGAGVAGGGDVDGDGINDFFVGATGDDRGGSGAGAVAMFIGDNPPPDGDTDDGDVVFHGASAGAGVGQYIGSGGDVDGDGLSDLVVGAPALDTAASNAGGVHLLLNIASLSGDVSLADADATALGVAADDGAGAAVCVDGDYNDDGYDDVLVGAPDEDTGDTSAGAAYLILGPFTGSSSLSSADLKVHGVDRNSYLGRAVAFGGDVDGDGHDELLFGADYVTGGARYSGSVFVYAGALSGTLSVTDADGELQGASTYDYTGASVDAVGTFTGNGRVSVIVGAWGNDDAGSSAGAAYILSGTDY